MDYLWLKTIHIISATILFGTGLGSAFYKFMTHRSGNVQAIATTDRLVVLADWLFTGPSVIVQLATGLWMASLAGITLTEFWLLGGLALYFFAGACWLPVVYLQLRMRSVSTLAASNNVPLERNYHRMMRIWIGLGYPAFLAMVLIFFLMVFKPTW